MFWTFYIRRGRSLLFPVTFISAYYVMCMDCGCQSASFRFENDEDRLDAAKRTAELWNSGKVIFTGRSE